MAVRRLQESRKIFGVEHIEMSGDTTATASIDVDLDVAEIDLKIPEDELKVSNLDI